MLYQHNQVVYDKVIENFNSGIRDLIIVQGTGTGKSFIVIELIKEYFKDRRVLYICPKESIEINIKKYKEFNAVNKMVDFKYNAAFNNDDFSNECLECYDVFIIDECHHIGSDIQGNNIRKIIEYCKNHTDKYAVGLTATPVRERNIDGTKVDVSTYFSCRIDGLSIFDAIEQGLMPQIEYLVCKPSKYLTTEEKKNYRQKLDIENSEELLKKIINANNKNSYLIFYSTIEEMKNNTEFIQKLIPNCRIINISSDDKESQKLLDSIKDDERVIIQSVNMLLEGLHLPIMDCIILFRDTKSLIILQQIIGRVSSINSKINPLIIDCTDSATNAIIKLLYEGENNNTIINKDNMVKTERKPILKISVTNSIFFDLSLLFAHARSFIYNGVLYYNIADAIKRLNIPVTMTTFVTYKSKHGLSTEEALNYYTIEGYNNYYCIPFRGKWYHSKADCLEEYGISYTNFKRHQVKYNLSFQDTMESCLNNKDVKKVTFDGIEYASVMDCCTALGIKYATVIFIKREKKYSYNEAIHYCVDRKKSIKSAHSKDRTKIRNSQKVIFNGIEYISIADCCESLGIDVNKLRSYKTRTKCTIEEAIEYYLNKEFVFNDVKYDNFRDCCFKLGLSWDTVSRRARLYNCTRQEAIQYYLDRKFIFNNIAYDSFKDCCSKLNLKWETVRRTARLRNCTKQEAIQYHLDKKSD